MFQKDFLMRQITAFIDALNQIINSIDKNDAEGAKININDAYSLLGNNAEHFLNTNIKDLLKSFNKNDGSDLKRIQFLAQLMYYDSITRSKHKKIILKKSILLMEYYIKNTKEYSFEMNALLQNMHDNLEEDHLF